MADIGIRPMKHYHCIKERTMPFPVTYLAFCSSMLRNQQVLRVYTKRLRGPFSFSSFMMLQLRLERSNSAIILPLLLNQSVGFSVPTQMGGSNLSIWSNGSGWNILFAYIATSLSSMCHILNLDDWPKLITNHGFRFAFLLAWEKKNTSWEPRSYICRACPISPSRKKRLVESRMSL